MSSRTLSTRRLALLSGFALLSVLGAASVCNAESPWRRRVVQAPLPPYRVSLEMPDGSPLPTFQQGGSTFVLGEPGEPYRIRVSNPSPQRVEAVVTVDGRDTISGALGDYVAQRGYLIEPWGSVLVEGFRRSWDEVAAFRFTTRARSYSARRGTPQHLGVIGVAVFSEKPRPPAPAWRSRWRDAPESEERAPARAPAPSKRGPSSGKDEPHEARGAGPSNIGTEYGENQASRVVEVAFERAAPTLPAAVLRLRYDDAVGLSARGIDLSLLERRQADEGEPEAFPHSGRRFAPPPP